MHQPGSHGAMAESPTRLPIKNCSRLLIEDGGALLLYDTVSLGFLDSVLQLRHIEPLGGPWLIAREVIARQENGHENRMGRIHPGVDHRDDAGSADSEALVRVAQADNLRRRLLRVTMGGEGAVIVHQSSVGKSVWRIVNRW